MRVSIAMLLLSGLYTDVTLWACKHATAQIYKGEAVHRTVIAYCIGKTLLRRPVYQMI